MKSVSIVSVVAIALAITACDDSEGPETLSVLGAYEATTLTTEEEGVTTDWLSLGASISLTLSGDGTTAGRLFIPGGAEDGSDFDVDLTGTWERQGTIVTLDHVADTFMRDMPFIADGMRLTGEETFGTVTVSVVLSK
jgi:hypothetical protein